MTRFSGDTRERGGFSGDFPTVALRFGQFADTTVGLSASAPFENFFQKIPSNARLFALKSQRSQRSQVVDRYFLFGPPRPLLVS
jgi:hypothetical protein